VGQQRVGSQGAAGQREQQRRHYQDATAVHGVTNGATDECADDQRDQLRQADQPDLERGPGQRVHLERDRHGSELAAEHLDQCASEQEAEAAAFPQWAEVDQDPVRHRSIVHAGCVRGGRPACNRAPMAGTMPVCRILRRPSGYPQRPPCGAAAGGVPAGEEWADGRGV
jgi:hypothetical protein